MLFLTSKIVSGTTLVSPLMRNGSAKLRPRTRGRVATGPCLPLPRTQPLSVVTSARPPQPKGRLQATAMIPQEGADPLLARPPGPGPAVPISPRGRRHDPSPDLNDQREGRVSAAAAAAANKTSVTEFEQGATAWILLLLLLCSSRSVSSSKSSSPRSSWRQYSTTKLRFTTP